MTKQSTPLLLMLLLFALGLQAQQKKANPEAVRSTTVNPSFFQQELGERNAADTLIPGAFNDLCALEQVVFIPDTEWGFVAGTNGFGDKEKAQLIENTTNTSVTINETWAFFSYAAAVGNGNLRMKIYSVDPSTGAPLNLLGQSGDIQVEDIQYSDTAFVGTPFTYTSPVTTDDASFFISVDFSGLYATFDTVGIYHTDFGCGDGQEAYELWSDDSWVSIFDAWVGDQDFDINFSLFAVVEFDPLSDVADPFYQQGELRLFPATPNPAKNSVRLNYELEQAGPVQIEIFSTDGRLLQHYNLGQQAGGRYSEEVELANFTAGAYVYSIRTERGRVLSRFVVK